MKYGLHDELILKLHSLDKTLTKETDEHLKNAFTSLSDAFLTLGNSKIAYNLKSFENTDEIILHNQALFDHQTVIDKTIKELKKDIITLSNKKQLKITSLNKEYRDKTTEVFRLKEHIPSKNSQLLNQAALIQRQVADKLQTELQINQKRIDTEIRALEKEYELLFKESKLSYDTSLNKINTSIEKENTSFDVFVKDSALELEMLKKQSDDNLLSIRQTFNQASISFNHKINELKTTLQSDLSDLKISYEKSIEILESSKQKLQDDYNAILSQSNAEYQEKMAKHNRSFDLLNKEYEDAISKITFEYNHAISLINSSLSSYKDSITERIKRLQQEGRSAKEVSLLTKQVNAYIKKASKEDAEKWRKNQRKLYDHEINHLKKLYQWRIEHGKIDLEHKQSALMLEHHLKMNLKRLSYQKEHFDFVLEKRSFLLEAAHLNNIAPLESQLNLAANIQERELKLLANDTSYLIFKHDLNVLEKKTAHQYKLNALEYQKNILTYARERDLKINQITFQIKLDSLKQEMESLEKKYELEIELSKVEYELSIIDATINTDTDLFKLNLESEQSNNLLSINIQKEKQKETVLSTILKESINSSQTELFILQSLTAFKKSKVFFDCFTDHFKDQFFLFQNALDQNLNIYQQYLNMIPSLTLVSDKNYEYDQVIAGILDYKKHMTTLNAEAKLTFDDHLNCFKDGLLELIDYFYESYYQFLEKLLHYNINSLKNRIILLEQKNSYYDTNILIKRQIIQKYNYKGYGNSSTQRSDLFMLYKYIRKDERNVNIIKRKIQKNRVLIEKLEASFTKDIQTLKTEQKNLVFKINDLELSFDKHLSLFDKNSLETSLFVDKLFKPGKFIQGKKLQIKLNTIFSTHKKKNIRLIHLIYQDFLKLYDTFKNHFLPKTQKVSFALLKLNSNISKNHQRYDVFLNLLNKDYEEIIYQSKSQIDAIMSVALEDFLASKKTTKDELFKDKDEILKKISSNTFDLNARLELLQENLASVLSSIEAETIKHHTTLNLGFKNRQTKLSEHLLSEKEKLKDMEIAIKEKNDAILMQYAKSQKKSIAELSHKQASFKKTSLKIANDILSSESHLAKNFKKTKRLSVIEISKLQSEYRQKIRENKQSAKNSYKKDLSEFKKSFKFKEKKLK
ncbi:MAG: hypothetical protein GX312_04295 [Candidatus Phytoplasma sp.]|nr:hypothetical protein [Phytoplasma sp.]